MTAPADGAGSPAHWLGSFAAVLPGLAAVAALVFTWVSVAQVSDELAISEQGQIADRYDTAVENLVDASVDVRRGAIYSMQSIMTDSPRTQPSVIDMLSKYVRDRATKNLKTTEKSPDIQAALYALGNRNPAQDGKAVIDLRGACLKEAKLEGMNLADADLRGTVLSGANAEKAILSGANLEQAVLTGADLTGADLSHAEVSKADLKTAVLADAALKNALLVQADLRDADLRGANLSGADLSDTNLNGAGLTGANLSGGDLSDTNLNGADLSGADLEGAHLTGLTWNDTTTLTGVHRPEGDLLDDAPGATRQPSPSRTPDPPDRADPS
ncbi:pentapeptide repeat-containing protein [Streptomyces sp. NPDC006012]|uniref:pentapeptide repeat-containing protein n=1 Tax=Streptomyces sp. NPDC006012 TaxID=3364739 RepID=UPI003693D3DB